MNAATRLLLALVPLAILGLGVYGHLMLTVPPSVVAPAEETESWEPAPGEIPDEYKDKLALVYAQKVGFEHVVGKSSCPESAGAISVGAMNKIRTELKALEVTGDIAPFIKVTPRAPEGVRITLEVEFTCEHLEKGVYSGTIEAEVGDPVSGASNHLSVPIMGTVK